MKLRFLYCLLVILLLSCSRQGLSQLATSFSEGTATAIPDQTRDWQLIPVSVDQPGSWTIYDPQDPSKPELFTEKDGFFQIQDSWEIENIDFIYNWGGLGEPSFANRRLRLIEGIYYLDGIGIDKERVNAILAAVTNLRDVQSHLIAIDHTDDYPHWQLDMLGADGNHIFIQSDSTANMFAAPWSVLYNGRIYSQLGGALGMAIEDVFGYGAGLPIAGFFSGDNDGDKELNYLFSTEGLPVQLLYGYEGLSYLSYEFSYKANPETRQIEGFIEKHTEPEDLGIAGMVLSGRPYIEQVDAVTITDTASAQALECQLEAQEPNEKEGIRGGWNFFCLIDGVALNDEYSYEINVLGTLKDGKGMNVNGRLFGVWSERFPIIYTPLPSELRSAFETNADIRSILSKLYVLEASYVGEETSLTQHRKLIGELKLLGNIRVQERMIEFTLTTPFEVHDGSLTRWTLGAVELEQFLADLLSHAYVRKALEIDPNLMLNLAYDESPASITEKPYVEVGYYPRNPQVDFAACEDLPGNGSYPQEGVPYRGFSFNQSPDYGGRDYVLIGKDIEMVEFARYGSLNLEDGLERLALPDIFETNTDLIELISMQRGSSYGFDSAPDIFMGTPFGKEPTDADVAAIKEFAAGISADFEYRHDDGYLWIYGVAPKITSSGDVVLVQCDPSSSEPN